MRLRRPRLAPAADVVEEIAPPPPVPGAMGQSPANPLADPEFVAGLRTVPSGLGDAPVAWEASDVSGVRPDGSLLGLDFDASERPVLLVFLSTNCQGCDLFWNGLRNDWRRDVEVMVVTKGPTTVSADNVRAVASGLVAPVVMSDASWTDFRVTSYPFLVLVEPRTRRILGEHVGFGWSDVELLLNVLDVP